MSSDPIASVEEGKLLGKTEKDITGRPFFSFHGIPYAKPPIGTLRFKDPENPEPWQGIRDATKEGSICLCSIPLTFDSSEKDKTMLGSEDCLFLNVFTHDIPKNNDSNLSPVMVYIHGGGFITGSGSRSIYGPEFFMTENIVLVTINYRLGAFGFLVIDDQSVDVPGNAGLKDQVQALKWIQKNIKSFGGDPNNVTIFGNSAGSASVHYLILSPLSKGLFHKAIMQSGTALNCWARGSSHNSEKLSEILGFKDTADKKKMLEFLQGLSAEEIIHGQSELGDYFDASKPRLFGPVVEKPSKNSFLIEDPIKLLQSGNYNHVPMILGYASREGYSLDLIKNLGKNTECRINDPNDFVPYFLCENRDTTKYKEIANKIHRFYFDGNPEEAHYILITDNFFTRGIHSAVKLHSKTTSKPIYYYRMNVDSELNVVKKSLGVELPGTAHADELGYLFKTPATPDITVGSVEDRMFRRFIKLWSNFARKGDPNDDINNAAALPTKHLIEVDWKPVENEEVLHFLEMGEDLSIGINPDRERMLFWDDIYTIVEDEY